MKVQSPFLGKPRTHTFVLRLEIGKNWIHSSDKKKGRHKPNLSVHKHNSGRVNKFSTKICWRKKKSIKASPYTSFKKRELRNTLAPFQSAETLQLRKSQQE